MSRSLFLFCLRAVITLVMAVFLSVPTAASACECKGMTWRWRSHTGEVDNVGTDNLSNAYQGDTSCSVSLPILCLRKEGLPKPSYITPDFYNGWTGGRIQLTTPRPGTELTSWAVADSICEQSFGPGWKMAEFHDGGGGWGWYAYGSVSTTGRFWVAINDQPANPWNCAAPPPPSPTRIQGHVKDNNGRPVANAVVEAASGYSAVTDASGFYSIPNLPLGTYTLRARKAGWAFGSPGFQNAKYTRSLTQAGQVVTLDIIGWNFDPVVFVHGWTSSMDDFARVPDALERQGYYTTGFQLDTHPLWTPPFYFNALKVEDWIDDAKYVTGRDKVILYGNSMGGLVARTYLESSLYDEDVSQIFTYGSPHLGTPNLLSSYCYLLPRPDAVCQMTRPGMALFNLTHFKRSGVNYHLVAGNAPMWTTKRICFRIFRKKICLISLPWPDLSFRNFKGWGMGLLIPGGDDGFIQTCSAAGQLGSNIDRYLTREVHSSPLLGSRDYHAWENALSQEGYEQCSQDVLVERNTLTCGTRSFAAPLSCLVSGVTSQAQVAPALAAANPELSQLSRVDTGVLHAGERRVRTVSIEGGETSFFATWEQGSTRFSLVDPTGKVIDPAYAASIQGDPDDPENVETSEPDPDVVLYSGEATHAVYYFPEARPGTWQLVFEGGEDIPAAGTNFTTSASFDSPLRASFSAGQDFYAPGATAPLRVRFSEPVASADVQVTLRRAGADPVTVTLTRVQGDEYAANPVLPQASGYVALDWSVSGQRADGVAFERGGREYLQLQSQALQLGSGHTDRAIPRTDAPGLNSALAVTLKVLSSYAGGGLGVYAELTAADGTVVARTHTSVTAQAGTNAVELRFRAEDIYLSKADGPYTLRNVRLLDERDAPLLGQEVALAHTTQAYAYRSFAPRLGTPSVFLDGPFQVKAGESISLSAVGVDPEGEVLAYAWDLDGDGQFERSGLPVTFSTSPRDRAGLRKVRVQVSDPQGHSAEAEDFVDILNPCTPNAGAFSGAGSTAALHLQHSSTRLEDGRVLVVGGYSRTVEVYDPAAGTWAATGSSRTTHRNHSATLLADGRVLVAGGEGASATASAEVYDPAKGTWAATGNLGTYRRHHGAVRLVDGRVLVMGGTDGSGALLASAEVYDPASGTWSATGRMAEARRTFSATLLNDGRVLVAGGLTDASSDKCNSTGSNCLASAEVYDLAKGTWASVGGMATARGYHAAVVLGSGHVLVAGGAMDGAQSTTAEVYDPASGAWTATGSLHSPRRRLALSVLPDGRVLATGGYDASTGILASAELYDPAAGRWCPTGSMTQGRYGHTATVLQDGRVLVTAGHSNASQYTAELYDLGE
jgi:hypothetical protein